MTPAEQLEMSGKVLDFIEVSAAFTKKADETISAYAEREKQAAAALPGAINALLAVQLISPQHQKEAEELLSTHAGALRALEMAVTKQAQSKARELLVQGGRATPEVNTKVATAGQEREIDRDFRTRILAAAGQ